VGNGVIIILPHRFEHPLRWYYRAWEVTKCELGTVTYGIMSTPNLMKIRPAILFIESVLTDTTCEGVGSGKVRILMGMRRGSWIMASSTFHLTTSSNCHVGITECRKLKKYEFGVVTYGTASTPTFMKIHPATLFLLNAYRRIYIVKWFIWVGLGLVSDAHAQRIMGNGVINIPPRDFKQLSRWYNRV
jgi:hypothetical protein